MIDGLATHVVLHDGLGPAEMEAACSAYVDAALGTDSSITAWPSRRSPSAAPDTRARASSSAPRRSVTSASATRTHAIELLLEHGVNHIDTAASYGDSELRLAPALGRYRDRFFLATKTGERTYAAARDQIQRSLERMQVPSVDLIQLHCLVHPGEWDVAMSEDGALRAAVEAREAGLVRFIGVTGHGSTVAEMHQRSLERFPFDSVLLPYSHVILEDEALRGRRRAAARHLPRARRRGADDQGDLARARGARRLRPPRPGTSRWSSRSTSISPCTGCSASRASSSTAPATSACCRRCSTRPSASASGRPTSEMEALRDELRLSTLFVCCST